MSDVFGDVLMDGCDEKENANETSGDERIEDAIDDENCDDRNNGMDCD